MKYSNPLNLVLIKVLFCLFLTSCDVQQPPYSVSHVPDEELAHLETFTEGTEGNFFQRSAVGHSYIIAVDGVATHAKWNTRMAWKTPLEAGKREISFAVIAVREGNYTVGCDLTDAIFRTYNICNPVAFRAIGKTSADFEAGEEYQLQSKVNGVKIRSQIIKKSNNQPISPQIGLKFELLGKVCQGFENSESENCVTNLLN